MEQTLLKVENLEVKFKTLEGMQTAVQGVSFDVAQGEVFCLVGESGCGKSLTSLSIMGLVEKPGIVEADAIILDGQDISHLKEEKLRELRGNKMSMIFQEPLTSLNPLFTVGNQMDEVFRLHQKASRAKAKQMSVDMLRFVGIPDPEDVYKRYPAALSGGMRQRVMIAMALSCRPKLLIADEPTTALDVTIQKQILKLMNELKKEKGTSILFITHDLGVINQMADEVAVMYCGQVVEMCKARTIFAKETTCSHPYTEGLMTSIPRLDTPVGARLEAIPGAVPHPLDLPKGCKFAPRCKYATEKCLNEEPKLELAEDNHLIRCFYPDKEARHAK